MANLTKWGRSSMRSMQREIEDVLDEFRMPRALAREVARMFDEPMSTPRSIWRAMDDLLEDFMSPTPLRSRIERIFGDVGLGTRIPLSAGRAAFSPEIALRETDDEYVLRADLPGVREQDVDVRIDDEGMLTVSGERREERTERIAGYDYNERRYGSFSRSIELPRGIDASKIRAELHDGVLEVHVLKAEAARGKKIPIATEEPRVLPSEGARAAQAPTQQGIQQPHTRVR